MLYRIGDFSKITGLSIRTLRYYDDIDLFKPIEVDLFTNYRYYCDSQLEDLKIINDLKDCGFSLEEIRDNWNNFSNSLMLEQKEKLLKEVELMHDRIRKVDYLRSNLESGKFNLKQKNESKTKEKSIFQGGING